MKLFRYCIFLFWGLLVLSSRETGAAGWYKAKDKEAEEESESAEFRFMKMNFSPENCTRWKPGRLFVYVPEKLNILFRPFNPQAADTVGSYAGKVFRFEGIAEETIFGDKYDANLIFESGGLKYRYETGKTYAQISGPSYVPLMPGMIPLDETEKADSLLAGRILYIRTSNWYNAAGEKIAGMKLVPVRVERVAPGNEVYPERIFFTGPDGTEASVFTSLSPVSMAGQSISFDRLFRFENPRLQYKNITDDVWEAITRGKVKKGMTKEECRLSLGRPNDATEIPTYGGLKEQWFYQSGIYLFFEDGRLTEFRQ